MELVAAVLFAFPLGLRFGFSRGLVAYLVVWSIIFPIQTTLRVRDDGDFNAVGYVVFNALVLLGGVVLNRWGARRAASRESAMAEGPA